MLITSIDSVQYYIKLILLIDVNNKFYHLHSSSDFSDFFLCLSFHNTSKSFSNCKR